MSIVLFLKEYILNPKYVGAVAPSSKYLAQKMIEPIDFKIAKNIVEFGPGTGVFTENILKKRNRDTKVLIIENNEKFYTQLKNRFNNMENLYIIHGSAENVIEHMKEFNIKKADYIVSGLPFASLPLKTSQSILRNAKEALSERGSLITFQYTLLKKKIFMQHFKNISITKEYKNIPPAHVFCCYNYD